MKKIARQYPVTSIRDIMEKRQKVQEKLDCVT